MPRFVSGLFLLVVLLTACSTRNSNVSAPMETSTLLPTMTPPSPSFQIIAYTTEGINPSLIPYEQLTQINYSFLIPNPNGTFQPIRNEGKLREIVSNGHAKNLTVLISVGGWGWDEQFETMAASPESRHAFVQNLQAFVNEYQLDGADIDWEYPDAGQSSQNFLALIRELRAALPEKRLTTAVVSYGDIGSGIPAESFAFLDFVNVMTYDGPDHGTMEQFEKGIAYWMERGVPKEKFIIGVPFYSRVKGSLAEGLTYAELVQVNPAAAQVDEFDYNGLTLTYNGIPTIQEKTRLAIQKASGIMFWALNHDAQGDLSLVHAIYQLVHTSS